MAAATRSEAIADHVARELKALHDAGFDGVAMGFVNYLDELPYFVEAVIPRLQRMGVRTANIDFMRRTFGAAAAIGTLSSQAIR